MPSRARIISMSVHPPQIIPRLPVTTSFTLFHSEDSLPDHELVVVIIVFIVIDSNSLDLLIFSFRCAESFSCQTELTL